MADVTNNEEPSLPSKRTPDLGTQDEDDSHTPKKLKLQDDNNNNINGADKQILVEQPQQQPPEDDEDDEEEEHSDGDVAEVIDRKGKGILIEEDEDDSDSDSDSGSGSDSGIGDNVSDDSDFVEDPLAEVDLDNILPSRTRRRPTQPGSYIANDIPEEDSEESDDPDA